jgi:CrcB protein
MKSFFYVFIGGGLGSIFRFAISKLISVTKGGFPWPTIFANLIGCFLIGFLLGWAIKNNGERSELYLLFIVGFCGGLTTFSTFSNEGLLFLKSADYLNFLIYILSSVIGGITLVGIGYYFFRLINS